MYRIKYSEDKKTVTETIHPRWLKQQKQIDMPIKCDSYEDADGVTVVDEFGNEIKHGIEGRNMQNYTPTVIVEEISGDPYISQQMETMQNQIDRVKADVAKVYSAQTYGTVPKTDLDAAYKEGVNSYGE